MLCTPASLSLEVGLGLGAQAGEDRLSKIMKSAGLPRVRRAAETPFNIVLEPGLNQGPAEAEHGFRAGDGQCDSSSRRPDRAIACGLPTTHPEIPPGAPSALVASKSLPWTVHPTKKIYYPISA
jgi:hypothetical protein